MNVGEVPRPEKIVRNNEDRAALHLGRTGQFEAVVDGSGKPTLEPVSAVENPNTARKKELAAQLTDVRGLIARADADGKTDAAKIFRNREAKLIAEYDVLDSEGQPKQ